MVTCQHEAAASAIPDGEGELAAEILHAVGTVILIEVEDGLHVGVGAEDMTRGLELRSQGRKIVDLSVGDHLDGAVFVGERLGATGDIGFGSADATGPVVTYANVLSENVACGDCEIPWPADRTAYTLPDGTTSFRMGWGEGGNDSEGWYPWWTGRIFLR